MKLPSNSEVAHGDPANAASKVSGSIFECVAFYTSLKATQQYKMPFGHVYRQQYSNSSSCNPLDDLRGLIETGEDVRFGDNSAYYLGNPIITTKEAHDLALHLAPYYKSEFTDLFGSKEAYETEMKKVNDKSYISPIMVTVIARALLCPIILYLPDCPKPIYFYPYPMKGGKASPQFGDYFRPPMRLTFWSDGHYSLLMPVGYDDEFVDDTPSALLKEDSGNDKGVDEGGKDDKGEDEDGKDDEKGSKGTRYHVHCKLIHLKRAKGAKHSVLNKEGKPVSQPVIALGSTYDEDVAEAMKKMRDPLRKILEERFPRDGTIYKFSDIEKFAAEEGVSTCTAICNVISNASYR